jgi:hypothetical protein
MELTRNYHQMLYLGQGSTLKPFKDKRLLEYWCGLIVQSKAHSFAGPCIEA